VFTGSGSLLLHPSEFIESRNEAEAILGLVGNQGRCKWGTRGKRLLVYLESLFAALKWLMGRESVRETGLGCNRILERSLWRAAAGDSDMERGLVIPRRCRGGVTLRMARALLELSCQAGPGDSVCGLRTVGVGTATDSRGGFVELWWNGGLVRERNGGFRADDLPAVGGEAEAQLQMSDGRLRQDDW
jgi:hypothetical protein